MHGVQQRLLEDHDRQQSGDRDRGDAAASGEAPPPRAPERERSLARDQRREERSGRYQEAERMHPVPAHRDREDHRARHRGEKHEVGGPERGGERREREQVDREIGRHGECVEEASHVQRPGHEGLASRGAGGLGQSGVGQERAEGRPSPHREERDRDRRHRRRTQQEPPRPAPVAVEHSARDQKRARVAERLGPGPGREREREEE